MKSFPAVLIAANSSVWINSRRLYQQYFRKTYRLALLEEVFVEVRTTHLGERFPSPQTHPAPADHLKKPLAPQTAGFFHRLNVSGLPILSTVCSPTYCSRYSRKNFRSIILHEGGFPRVRMKNSVTICFIGATAAIFVTGRTDAGSPGEDAVLANQNIFSPPMRWDLVPA